MEHDDNDSASEEVIVNSSSSPRRSKRKVAPPQRKSGGGGSPPRKKRQRKVSKKLEEARNQEEEGKTRIKPRPSPTKPKPQKKEKSVNSSQSQSQKSPAKKSDDAVASLDDKDMVCCICRCTVDYSDKDHFAWPKEDVSDSDVDNATTDEEENDQGRASGAAIGDRSDSQLAGTKASSTVSREKDAPPPPTTKSIGNDANNALTFKESSDFYGVKLPNNLHDPNNALLICDGPGCNRCYHQRCHFVPVLSVPRGQWHCLICQFKDKLKNQKKRVTKPENAMEIPMKIAELDSIYRIHESSTGSTSINATAPAPAKIKPEPVPVPAPAPEPDPVPEPEPVSSHTEPSGSESDDGKSIGKDATSTGKDTKDAANIRCNCKKSKCLKLYCLCFAAKTLCKERCSCQDCANGRSPGSSNVPTAVLVVKKPLIVQTKPAASDPDDEKSTGDDAKDDTLNLGCNCKRSKCLKLYCQCFAAKAMCEDRCTCNDCRNVVNHTGELAKAIQTLLKRNPTAFETKFKSKNKGGKPAHMMGCRCKRSQCLKKYCECFVANAKCSTNCRCEGCKNMPLGGPGSKPNGNVQESHGANGNAQSHVVSVSAGAGTGARPRARASTKKPQPIDIAAVERFEFCSAQLKSELICKGSNNLVKTIDLNLSSIRLCQNSIRTLTETNHRARKAIIEKYNKIHQLPQELVQNVLRIAKCKLRLREVMYALQYVIRNRNDRQLIEDWVAKAKSEGTMTTGKVESSAATNPSVLKADPRIDATALEAKLFFGNVARREPRFDIKDYDGDEDDSDSDSDDPTKKIKCCICFSGHVEEDNDVVMCDGAHCFRAFHMKCCSPHVTQAMLDKDENEVWFCPYCVCFATTVDYTESEYYGYESHDDDAKSWEQAEDVFPEADAQLKAAEKWQEGKRNNNSDKILAELLGIEIAKVSSPKVQGGGDISDDDKSDTDFSSESKDSGSSVSSDSDASAGSAVNWDVDWELSALSCSESESDDDDSDRDEAGNKVRRSRRLEKGSESESGRASDVGRMDTSNIVRGKRRRTNVDYKR